MMVLWVAVEAEVVLLYNPRIGIPRVVFVELEKNENTEKTK
jgi:hypothetical protein